MKDLVITTYYPDNLLISLPHVLKRQEIDNFRITISCDNPDSSILGLNEIYSDIILLQTPTNLGMFRHRLFCLNHIQVYGDSESIMFMDDDDILLQYPDPSEHLINTYQEQVIFDVKYLLNPDLVQEDVKPTIRKGVSGAILNSQKTFKFLQSLHPIVEDLLKDSFGTTVINSAEDVLFRTLASQYAELTNTPYENYTQEPTMIFNRVRTRVNRYSIEDDPMYQAQGSLKDRNFFITKATAKYRSYLKNKYLVQESEENSAS